MTKKHFEAMAHIVRNALTSNESEAESRDIALAMMRGFIELSEHFNPRFDRARFMRACGLEAK